MPTPLIIGLDRRPTRADLALATSLLGVAVLSGLFIDVDRPDTTDPSLWWQWLLLATPPLLVAVRRIDPIVVAGLATVAQATIWVSNLPEVLLSMIVILYTAASDAGRRGIQVAAACSLTLTVVTAVGVAIADDVVAYQLPLIALTCGTAVVLGASAARQREVARQLAAEVAEARLRSEFEQAQAIANERSHIARELHDIVGHTLAVIAVSAEAADRVAASKPDAARDAVASIATLARSALSETRRVLSGLRESAVLELSPPPDLDATILLVEGVADRGIDATVVANGCRTHVPPASVAGGAHRIVQESLTNAIKHGGPTVNIEVELTCRADELEVRVTNTLTTTGHDLEASESPGIGLLGMVERAEVLGGTLEAQAVEGRFIVRATLPTGKPTTGSTP